MAETLRPCDCKDEVTARRLNEQGVSRGDSNITVQPNVVVLSLDNGRTTIRIPMSTFKIFAEWYLEPQDPNNRNHF